MRFSQVLFCIIISAIVAGCIGFLFSKYYKGEYPQKYALESPTPKPTPLAKYEFNIQNYSELKGGELEILDIIEDEEEFTSYKFRFTFDPEINSDSIKQTTGQINIPKYAGQFPIILMARGYVDQSIFETGVGTRPSASFYASHGFITVAPDFLGYGESDTQAVDIFEARFQTYTTFLSLLNTFDKAFAASTRNTIKWNGEEIFLWGHSNGGQIVLTVLALTNREIPSTLWAPVTKPFPYSILYYTDESQDGGKFIRKKLAEFEEVYDVDKFSFTNYLDRISAPLLIHQGGADSAVPGSWSNSFVTIMRREKKDIAYHYYPGADHNLRPDWDTVVQRDVDFFRKFTQN